MVEFLCRYVPLSATIGPPRAGLRAVFFRTRSSLIRFEGFTLMYRSVMSSPSSAPLKTAIPEHVTAGGNRSHGERVARAPLAERVEQDSCESVRQALNVP